MRLALAISVIVFLTGMAIGDPEEVAILDEVQELRQAVQQLKAEVDQVHAQYSENWLTQRRSEEVRALVQDVLADSDTRASLLQDGIQAGYKDGFFISSADGSYSLRINGLFQMRWLYNNSPGNNPKVDYGFEIRRLRIEFSGHVVDETWKYKFVLASNRNSVTNSNANIFAEDAYLSKSLGNGLTVKFGQYKVPYLREQIASASRLLAVDRTIINARYTWARSQGIGLNYASDQFTVDFMYNDGPKHINLQALENDANNGLAVRGQALLAGTFRQFSGMSGMPGGEFGVLLGGAFAWTNAGYKNAILSYPREDKNQQNYGFTVDASLQGNGWNAMTYFVWNNGQRESNEWEQSWGFVAQGGMFIADPLELFAQYSLGHIDDANTKNTSWLTVGFNYYPVQGTTEIKFSTDFGWGFDPIEATYSSTGTGVRESENDGEWLFRTQMQLTF
ncbi:MAG: porin [Phycisphaerales bacterium]|nr:porin [Phycisphaerales bacterium]